MKFFTLINKTFTPKDYFCGKEHVTSMEEIKLTTTVQVYTYEELPPEELKLAHAAMEATRRSYAPYSHFEVGAAVLLENGCMITGTNQENAAYPSGICAERTALFTANSQYPDQKVITLAIAARRQESPTFQPFISPCGACRQVMAETEQRFNAPMKVMLCGNEKIYVIRSAMDLLPLSFKQQGT